MKEIWKDIPEYLGLYQVSDLGRVRSFHSWRGEDFRILKEYYNYHGYMEVSLWKHGKKKTSEVHRLVAESHIVKPDSNCSYEVLHGPNGKTDNSINNLSWGTRSENMKDTVRDGTNFQANKEECPLGHILFYPNLTKWEFDRGRRKCRACANTRATYGSNRDDFVILADARYDEILRSV